MAGTTWPSAGTTFCHVCGCPMQRTPSGTVRDGLRAHLERVHPERALHPSQRSTT